ncbi:MAG: SUMF1/EgtB/PvdO family nonheme iron enzyme [Eubacteriales bacterium]
MDDKHTGMVLVPSGEYMMGSDKGYPEEAPIHKVKVNPFYMDTKPVTNAQYRAFCDETGHGYPASPNWVDMPDSFRDYPDHPVINIGWGDAMAYAKWAGKRLPTEEEWEWAARGGLDGSLYPWGDENVDGSKANFCDKNADFPWFEPTCDDGWKYTSPVGVYPPNGYGLFDMAGNVFEWVEDWMWSYADTVHDTEAFKDGWGGSRVARGGCWFSIPKDLRVTRRMAVLGGGGNAGVGFRCVMDIEGTEHREKDILQYKHSEPGWDNFLDDMRVVIPEGQELCIGYGPRVEERVLRHYKNMGVTSIEEYVTWESCEREGCGKWDFSMWDGELKKIKDAGLKWLPFVIAGPAYSLPDWYRASREFEGLVCIEHNVESKIQSFWDKNFYIYIKRFLKELSEHFDHGDIEGLLFGISGDFGEAIGPVSGGGWTFNIPGVYHTHSGYWAGDRFARADFREKMKGKFGGDLARLNASWGTDFKSFGAVCPPEINTDIHNFRVYESSGPGSFNTQDACGKRRFIDFIDWYRESMTQYASFWMETARRYFPDTELYLCTGGQAEPWHASEFAQQSKICAQVGGGVRITNEASDYNANFTVTNWVTSASRFYGGYFSFEPAGQVTERGVVCRVYNAAATGAKSLHYYGGNIMGNKERAENFAQNVHFLREGGLYREIGLLYPDTPIVLDANLIAEMNSKFSLMRDYTDYDFICDLTVSDGILDNIKALIIKVGGYYKTETLEKILSFVQNGGTVIGIDLKELRDLDGDKDYLDILFGSNRQTGKGHTLLIGGALSSGIAASSTSSQFVRKASDKSATETMQREICDPMTSFLEDNGIYVTDGVLDDVFTAERYGKLLIMNYSGKDKSRSFRRTNGETIYHEVKDLEILEV